MAQGRKLLLLMTVASLPSLVHAQDEFDLSAAPVKKGAPPLLVSSIEAGMAYQNTGSYYFGRYGGVLESGLFPTLELSAHNRAPWESGRTLFWDLNARIRGVDNRALSARVGEQGKWRFAASYDSFIRAFTESARTPFDGAGTGRLSLPANWISSAASQGFVNIIPNLKPLELQTRWQSVGGAYVSNPKSGYEVSVRFGYRQRDGLRPQGITFGNEANYPVGIFIPQPVDYETHRAEAGISYADRTWQWSASYHFAAFRNGLSSVTVQNPYLRSIVSSWPAGGLAGYPFAFGQFSLPPDSAAHQFMLSGGHALTERTRLTARVSYTIQTQNDAFLPYTANEFLNVPTPLPRASFNGKVHKTYISVGFTSREWKNLDFTASYTFDNRDNRSSRSLYTYVTNDAQDQPQPLTPGVSPYFRYNLPYSFSFQKARAEIGYRIAPRTRVSVGYDGDFRSRTYQARAYTAEQAFKAKVLSTFRIGAAWVSYRHANRSGGEYHDEYPWNISHTDAYVGASPFNRSIGYPLLRKYDLADRKRHEAKVGFTVDPGWHTVFTVSGSYASDDYHNSLFGLRSSDTLLLDADVAYTKGRLAASLFYSFEQIRADQRGYYLFTRDLNDPQRIWDAKNRDQTHTAGLKVDWQAVPEKLKLRGSYYLSNGTNHINVLATPFTPLAVTRPLPDGRAITHNAGFGAEYAFRPESWVRVGYTLERHVTKDWQYEGASLTPVAQILGSGILVPRYTAHVIGVSVRQGF